MKTSKKLPNFLKQVNSNENISESNHLHEIDFELPSTNLTLT